MFFVNTDPAYSSAPVFPKPLFVCLIFSLPEILSSYSSPNPSAHTITCCKCWFGADCLLVKEQHTALMVPADRKEVNLWEGPWLCSALCNQWVSTALCPTSDKTWRCCTVLFSNVVSGRQDKNVSRHGGCRMESDIHIISFAINATKNDVELHHEYPSKKRMYQSFIWINAGKIWIEQILHSSEAVVLCRKNGPEQ